jgi:hypothetical protein
MFALIPYKIIESEREEIRDVIDCIELHSHNVQYTWLYIALVT